MIRAARCVAGLDVGATMTRAVVAEADGSWDAQDGVRILGVGEAATEGVRDKIVTNIEAATESIRAAVQDAERMAGSEVEGLYVGIAGGHIEAVGSLGVVAVGSSEVSSEDVARAHEVARAVVIPPDRELVHAIPLDYALDGRRGIQDPEGMAATRLETEVCLITAASPVCDNLRKAVGRAGFRVGELVLGSLASNLAVLGDEQREAGVVLVEVGGSATEVIAFHEGRIRFLSSLPWGACTVTNDIVKGLGVSVAEARRLKEDFGSAKATAVDSGEMLDVPGPLPGGTRRVSRELLAHIIEQRLDEIFGLVYEELDERGLLDGLQGGIVLTGGGSEQDGILELAQDVFNRPIQVGLPGRDLAGIVDPLRSPRQAAAVGLARYGALRQRDRRPGAAGRALNRATDWLKDFF